MASADTATGLAVPTGGDPFDPQGDIVELATSITPNSVIPVVNATAQEALLAALTATGAGPTASRPVRLHRLDLEAILSTDGSTWRALTGSTLIAAIPTGATFGAGGGTLGITSGVDVPARPWPQRVALHFSGLPTALAAGGYVETALRKGTASIRAARTVAANSSAGGTYIDVLAAGVGASYQAVAISATAAEITADSRFTYLTATVTGA